MSRSPGADRSWSRRSKLDAAATRSKSLPPFVAVALERMAALGLKPEVIRE